MILVDNVDEKRPYVVDKVDFYIKREGKRLLSLRAQSTLSTRMKKKLKAAAGAVFLVDIVEKTPSDFKKVVHKNFVCDRTRSNRVNQFFEFEYGRGFEGRTTDTQSKGQKI